MKKKIILFIMLIVLPFMVYANEVKNIDMDIYIDNNGDAHITETWDTILDSGTEGYHPYFDIGKSKIELISASMDNEDYEIVTNWDISSSLSNKAYKAGLYYDGNETDICFGISNYGSHTYKFEYIISNFVLKTSDADMVYWTLFPKGFNASPESIHIKIYSDFKYSDTLDVWGYGNIGGTCYVYDGYIEMNLDRTIDTDEYMTILVKYPESTFNTSNTTTNNFNYYYEMAEVGATKHYTVLIKKYSLPFLIVFIIISIIYWAYLYIKYDKEYESTFNEKYLREFPSNDSPAMVEYLLKHIVSNLSFSTSIINMVYKKGLLLEEVNTTEKGLLKSKDVKDYIFTKNDKDLKEELSPEEVYLRDALISKFGENDSFKMSAIKDASKKEATSRKIVSIYNKWLKIANKEANKKHFFEKIDNRGLLYILPILGFIISIVLLNFSPYGIATLAISLLLIIYVSAIRKKTKEGLDLYDKWTALKNFLCDFGSFKDKELPEISMWEKYLVYANIFGIAEKLEKQMRVKIPELYGDDYNLSTFDYIYISSAINRNITREINNSLSSAHAQMAESYSSGGGGFSSGGGGGGSFGGGGSGGGFR